VRPEGRVTETVVASGEKSRAKSIYRMIVPEKIRYWVFMRRHPEHRLGEKLGHIARQGIESFMDSLARERVLGGKILEVGSGGRETNKKRFAVGANHFWRSDISFYPKPRLDILCDCTQMPFLTGSLDALVCSEVLEHIPDILKAIAEITRILKPGGHLVLTVPFLFPLHGVTKEKCADFWRLTPGNLQAIFQKDFSLIRKETVNLFHPEDSFVVGIQQLWRRKNPNP
jgi:SAM-dependent methyltransferase